MKDMKKLKSYLFTAVVFGGLYFVSKVFLDDFYLFQWTARHYYLYVWILSTILIYYGKPVISYAITLGNILGILLGQFLGGYVRARNILKITMDMPPEQKQLLYHHPGVEYWIAAMAVFTIAGILIHIRRIKIDQGKKHDKT